VSEAPSELIRLHAYSPPPDEGLWIVYQDEHLIAIDKPAGLLSVPGRGAQLQDCALHRVQLRFPQALLVHRLDEVTSGLLLFALSASIQKSLNALFETRQVRKTYHAWVHGLDLSENGVIDAPIAVDWPRRPMRKIDHEVGQSAITHFQTLSKNERTAQISCRLEPQTGRTHQLRVHMQHTGHPIVGDRLYGLPEDTAPRLMLHASGLCFTHPVQPNRSVDLLCPAPF
jgi:tRNA pseudouridine32 synthase / 23S rRNA pseudouridine746 synthase